MRAKRQPKRHQKPILYQPRELADLLGLKSLDTLRKWRRVGKGPKFIRSTKFTVVYLHDDVMEWMKRHRHRVQRAEKSHGPPPRPKRKNSTPIARSSPAAS